LSKVADREADLYPVQSARRERVLNRLRFKKDDLPVPQLGENPGTEEQIVCLFVAHIKTLQKA
jgi:hypothetical protein